MAGHVCIESRVLGSDRPWHPRFPGSAHGPGAEACLPTSRLLREQPRPSCDVQAIAASTAAPSRSYEALLAEANELLHKVSSLQPAEAAESPGDCLDTAKAVKEKTPAAHNKLAVVRVRVAGRTFGVPAELAKRISMYTDNATKQLQLDRQCTAYKQQRRLRSQQLAQHSQKVDHVLLNKTAILLPASMLEGKDIPPLLLATAREHSQSPKQQRSRPKTAAPKSAKPNSRAVRPTSATTPLRGKDPRAPIIITQSAQPDKTEGQALAETLEKASHLDQHAHLLQSGGIPDFTAASAGALHMTGTATRPAPASATRPASASATMPAAAANASSSRRPARGLTRSKTALPAVNVPEAQCDTLSQSDAATAVVPAARAAIRQPARTLSRPSVSIPQAQQEAVSQSAVQRSPKPTLLRDQHMPGQVLHQKSSFPSDIFMRHEAACTSPSALQQTSSAAGIFKELQGTAAAESETQPQAAARRSPKPTLLRDQHMPGELLHQKTAFPSDVFMRHEAAMQQLPSADRTVKESQQQQADLPVQQQTATAGRSRSNWAGSRPASPTAASDTMSSVPPSVTMLPAAVSVALPPSRSDSTASELALGSLVQGSVQSPRRGTSSRLKQSSKKSPRTARPAAEPWFEGTSHDLARSKTWATEWLTMGAQEEQAAAVPQSAQLLQHQSLHQQPVHQAIPQQPTQQSPPQSGHVSSHPSELQSAQPTHQSQQLPGNPGSSSNAKAAAAHLVHDSSMTDEPDVSDLEGRTPTNDEVQTRPWTAPDSLLKAATSPWVLDVRRLHSARPGSGGSPTARSDFLADSQALRQKRKAHEAAVRQRRLQFQQEKYEHQLQAAGFVVGLPATQKHRQRRLMWLHMVAAYQLRRACRAHVQQHKQQQMQEQRKSAAVKIAVWYKRLSETKQARQSLKAHRQLLPLTSLDKRREEEEKVAAASTIVCFLQDLQRGHTFVRAVQTFHLKVQRLQQLWRNTAAVRQHQRQLLFMQLQRFTERHAAKLVRTGAAFLSGATLSATSASATRKGTMAASCLRRSRPGSGKATMTGTTLPFTPRPAPAISEAVLWQVVDVTLKELRKQYFADLDSFWDARNIYQAQLQVLQHRAQVLSLKRVDSLPGILPPMQPRFRLLQSSQQLKAMLVRCHEINEVNNSLILEQQAITVTAGNVAMEEDEQLQDTMLAAYWAAVNV